MRSSRIATVGLVLTVMVLALAACGDGSTAPSVTGSPGSTAAIEVPAPDFSLELGDGATFLLSQEVLPVYMVFWAEW